jgi:hypothetical protein
MQVQRCDLAQWLQREGISSLPKSMQLRQMAQDAASIDVAAAIAPSSAAAEQIQSSPKKSLSSSAEADASTAGTSLL